MSKQEESRRGPASLLDVLRESGGEIGRDLATVDWSATPLGQPEGWDRSLQTMVRTVVASRFAMWMAWGPSLTFFCNDAYRRDTLAGKYPWALGRPAAEVWEEIWDAIGPRIEHVLRTGEATFDTSLPLFLERSGYVEETYHTFSYSPLHGDSGEAMGMLCVVTEETERVVGERRMATLREVGAVEGGGRDERAYLREAAAALATNNRSLPFTLVYLLDDHGLAQLTASSGVSPEADVAPATIDALDASAAWPVAAALRGEFSFVDTLTRRFDHVPTGGWPEPPNVAAVVPLLSQVPGAPPVGFLIAGANKYRPVDESFRSFVELLAAQLASGVASARAYEAERERAEELARLDAAKTTFFTNVSHELRTPLTLLLSPAEEMLTDRSTARSPVDRERLELIVNNGQRLLKLVNTLLDFSRLETGRAGAMFEATDLSEYTRELVSMFESAFARGGLTLAIECPPLPRPVWVDREMWAKIVLNLVSNALKFTLEGNVTVRLLPHGENVRLEVVDTGIGISPEDQDRLFERFQRVEGTSGRSFEGTGIGLALVAQLIDTHGGRYTIDSTLGAGSVFGVELPYGPDQLPTAQLVPDGASHAPASRAAGSYLAEMSAWLPDVAPTTAEPGGSGRAERLAAAPQTTDGGGDRAARILVVDDNADMRRYVTSLLSDRHVVSTATDGVSGLESAVAEGPDLILTDVMMPRMGGFELLDALRSDPRTMHIPVVMLSARAGEEGMVEGLEAGAEDYLIKPFTARELIARVSANLELDRVRRVRDRLQHIQQLQDQAERLAQVGSWEIDLINHSIRTSAQFQAMVGRSAEDLAALDYERAILQFVVPEDRAAVQASIETALRTGEPFTYELRFIGHEDRQLLARGEVLHGDDGHPSALRGFMQDITQQRAAERAIAAAAAAQERAEREHAIADELQRSLLPSADLSSTRLQAASFYKSGVEGTRAGGDFYDVIDLDVSRTAVVIGDVSGRGVRAASLMGQLRAAIRAHARLDLRPAEVLEQLDLLVKELEHRSLVTCLYGIHDSLTQTFVYANAGHLPGVLKIEDEPIRRLPGPTGPPLGVGGAQYMEESTEFPPGATLVLYTDGLVERRRTPIDDNIARLLEAVDGFGESLQDLPNVLVSALDARDVDDDVAIIAVRSNQAVAELTAEHDVQPLPIEVSKARRWTGEVLSEWDIPTSVSQDAITIVSELVTNAISYGRPPVRLRLRASADELMVEVDDALAAMPRQTRLDVTGDRGRGLWIVAQLAQRWSARSNGKGKTVSCALTLPAATRMEP